MPVAAAAILQRIADFLAIGAVPPASTDAGADFSALLASNATAPAASQAEPTGKTLPLDRQDPADPTNDLLASDLEQPSAPVTIADQTTATSPAEAHPSTAAMLTANDPLPIPALPVTPAPDTASETPAMQTSPAEGEEPAPPSAKPALAIRQSTHAPRQIAAVRVSTQPIISTSTPIAPEVEVEATSASQAAAPSLQPTKPAKTSGAPVLAKREQPITRDAETSEPTSDPLQPTTVVAVTDVIAPSQPAVPSPDAPIATATPAAPPLPVTKAAPAPLNDQVTAPTVIATTPTNIATPTPTREATPEPARADRQTVHTARADRPVHHTARSERQSVHRGSTAAKSEAPSTPVSPVDEPAAATPSSIVTIANAAPEIAKVPVAAPITTQTTGAVDQPTPIMIAPAVAVPAAPALPEMIAQPVLATPQIGSAELPAEQPAVAATRAAVAQPVQNPSTPASPAAQPPTPIVTVTTPGAAPAPTQSSITFVARPTRPVASRTPVPQQTEASVPAAKADAGPAPVATDPTATAERETPPFRATARQILAVQPATTDTPRATEAETTVRAPAADTAPTIGQQLAPAAHGGERIIATAAPTAPMSLSTEQAAALVETIQMLRSEAKSDAMTLAVDHDELGKITMRFDRTDHGVAVRIDSPDPSVAQLIANSAPALRSSGDNVGMRFERQDTSGSGAGSSRDAPRQGAGQDRNPTPYAQSSRPRASGQRDGLFA